jgi:hypothetical protein
MYRSTGETSSSNAFTKQVEEIKKNEAGVSQPKYEDLPVAVDGRGYGTNIKCVPNQYFAPRWWKKGHAWTDSGFEIQTNEVYWHGLIRGDMENICDCINNPAIPDILDGTFNLGRAQLTDEQKRQYVAAAFGPNNSQRRVDFCWTRYLQRHKANLNPYYSRASWMSSMREPQEVKDAMAPQLPSNVRVKNFPNPCLPHVHVPPACDAVTFFNNADAARRGHHPVTVVEKQPIEPAWIFGTYRIQDRAANELNATKDAFKPGVDPSTTDPIAFYYGKIQDLNKAREYARNVNKKSVSGVGTNKALSLGAVGLATVTIGGLVFLMTRKK